LLKLSEHEYQVARSRNSRQQGGGQQPSQQQLEQLDLKAQDDRYETQRQASEQQSQQSAEQREQLQALNRLKELAQRQQDLNERIKELQTALQEARTEQEREEIRRRLKRLREEEQEMLADVDELRQRMERPENQSRMAEARQQLDQTRSDVQRAAEALNDNSASQALSSGTRAQRQLQQLTDDFRKKSSNRFADEMRQMRSDARELAQKQEELAKKLEALAEPKHKTLSDSDERKDLASQLTQQKGGLTNLFNEMRRVSEQSESAEPLLSKQLYDTLRQTDQSDPDKALDLSAELVTRGFLSQAGPFEQRARKNIDALKSGVEKAAESVLGDDVEALRLARRELEALSQQLEKEIAQGDTNGVSTNLLVMRYGGRYSRRPMPSPGAESGDPQTGAESQENSAQQPGQAAGEREQASNQQPGSRAQPGRNGNQKAQSQEGNAEGNNSGQKQSASAQEPNGSSGSQGQGGNSGGQQAGRDNTRQNGQRPSLASGSQNNRGGQAGGAGGGDRRNFFDGGARTGGYGGGGYEGGGVYRPLTGDEFVDWSDRLRDVEEMVDLPEVRNEVARIRDRARVMRMDFKREGKKPDWAVVRLQIAGPLVEVRDRVAEELARRESNDALVPIDRDPVPPQFSELVRRYYEQLGKSE
jgi:hypothetical protein